MEHLLRVLDLLPTRKNMRCLKKRWLLLVGLFLCSVGNFFLMLTNSTSSLFGEDTNIPGQNHVGAMKEEVDIQQRTDLNSTINTNSSKYQCRSSFRHTNQPTNSLPRY